MALAGFTGVPECCLLHIDIVWLQLANKTRNNLKTNRITILGGCCQLCYIALEICSKSTLFLCRNSEAGQRRHVRWTTAASQQSNFRGKDADNWRLLFCYILTPITVLIEPANVSMAKVVQIQSLLFVPLLLKFKAIILFAALLSLSLQWLSNPSGSNLTVLFFISIFSLFWEPQIGAFSRDIHPNHWILALSLSHRLWNLTIIRTFLCDILRPNQ